MIYPESCAALGYASVSRHASSLPRIAALKKIGDAFQISIYSVYLEIGSYAAAHRLPAVQIPQAMLHGARYNVNAATPRVRDAIFGRKTPSAADYVRRAGAVFRTPFFTALKAHVQSGVAGHGYIQHALDVPLADAKALHVELARASDAKRGRVAVAA